MNDDKATTPIAVFDLDGTLLVGDSFLPFVFGYAWKHYRLGRLFVPSIYVAARVLGVVSSHAAKQGVLSGVFRGEASDRITEYAETFCRNWMACKVRHNVELRLRDHLRAGHRVLLVSASPDLYVTTFARLLGIPEVVCTRVSQFDGTCTGELASANCKGQHKLSMLQRHLGSDSPPTESYAYGDSISDFPIVKWVGRGFLIKRSSGRIVPLTDFERMRTG